VKHLGSDMHDVELEATQNKEDVNVRSIALYFYSMTYHVTLKWDIVIRSADDY
jgi:hypothetical protein